MNTFTASNGLEVVQRETGGYRIAVPNSSDLGVFNGVYADQAEALREFFRAEEDNRLGRWRYDSTTVVYADGDRAVVLDERRPHLSNEFDRRHFIAPEPGLTTTLRLAARAYFDAHPEPKPWHDAKPGEVWLLRIPTGPTFDHAPAVVSSSANGNVIFTAATYDAAGTEELALTASQITYATRIYPEEVAS